MTSLPGINLILRQHGEQRLPVKTQTAPMSASAFRCCSSKPLRRGPLALAILLLASTAHAAGLAGDDHFTTCAPTEQLAAELLDAAATLRADICRQWLGHELDGPRTIVHLKLSDSKDEGTTLPGGGPKKSPHMVWLVTNRASIGATLEHELTHAVFATEFGDALPVWAHEGAASQADDAERKIIRARLVAGYRRSGHWPSVAEVFASSHISPGDQDAYTVSAEVTRILIARSGKPKFLAFAVQGKSQGYDQALREHYGIAGVRGLEAVLRRGG